MTNTSSELAQVDWKRRRDQIKRALAKYKGDSSAGTEYFIWFNRRSFPPKEIRSLVEKKAKNSFSGGGKTNQMFRDLGYAVVKGLHQLSMYEKPSRHEVGKQRPVLDVSIYYLRDLFQKRWRNLQDWLNSGKLSDWPGVYVLAYAHESLEGKPVKSEDIFYVGMSTTSLSKRLKQFWDGIHDGGHHSGARTFYQRWAGNRPFDRLSRRGTFYVATIPIECETRKGLREPKDLKNLGLVAALEFYVLAHVKSKIGLEPPLNKK